MALSTMQGFDTFLKALVPSDRDHEAKARHRASVESSLRNGLPVRQFRETGSFTHGTGIRNHTDVDLMVDLDHSLPESSGTALAWVKSTLAGSFPYTRVRVSRPAVVVDFAGGEERWEVIPAFRTERTGSCGPVYNIPGPATGWIQSAPAEHLAYVTAINKRPRIEGGAKKLARLMKAWKYFNNVPVSSFYLEMRAAQYMADQSTFSPLIDLCFLLERLEAGALPDMNDPMKVGGRFSACSTSVKRDEALSKLKTGAARAGKALEAHTANDEATATAYVGLLFNGRFPYA